MKIEILAYNKRQIIIMEEKITLYYQGNLPVMSLVNDLFNIMQRLQEFPDDLKRLIISKINGIDAVYAIALDREKEFLDHHDQLDINEYIATIQSRLGDYKKEHKLDEFDEEYETYKLLYPENNNDGDAHE